MARPRNALNVSDAERECIRQLFVAGVRVAEIAKRVGRGESVVYRAVRGLKRVRPSPKPTTKQRDRLILQLVVERGVRQTEVAARFGITPTRVCQIVREAREPRMTQQASTRAAANAGHPPKRGVGPATAALERAVRLRRDRRIVQLVLGEGMRQAVVARRFGLTRARVNQIIGAHRAT